MKNEYGTEINRLIQGKLKFTRPNYGQIPRCFNEVAVYDYHLVTVNGTTCTGSFQFNVIQAKRFAENNGLTVVKYVEEYDQWLEDDYREGRANRPIYV